MWWDHQLAWSNKVARSQLRIWPSAFFMAKHFILIRFFCPFSSSVKPGWSGGGSYPKRALSSSCNSLITCRARFVLGVVVAFPYMFMASSNYSYGSTARHKFWRFQAWRFQSHAEPHGNDSQSYNYKNNYIARGKEWQEMSPKEISAMVTGSGPAL